MRRVARVLLRALLGVAALIAVLGALAFYFVYAPAPEVPRLSGTLSRGSLEADGRRRTYLTYVPRGLARGAPLVMVLHGAGENGATMRAETGYGFERLADQHGFALVYPDAFGGDWNACNIEGGTNAIDDVGFLTRLIDRLAGETGADQARVFAAGVSHGGQMAYRLALEAPSRFAAVAVVSANLPAPENFKCRPVGGGTPSILILNGTQDPLEPFDGGEVSLFGLFYRYGPVRSAHDSARYFAQRNALAGPPRTQWTDLGGGARLEQVLWHGGVEVELAALHGGGHGMPQPYRHAPRILGPSLSAPNGPAMIWDFFARQK